MSTMSSCTVLEEMKSVTQSRRKRRRGALKRKVSSVSSVSNDTEKERSPSPVALKPKTDDQISTKESDESVEFNSEVQAPEEPTDQPGTSIVTQTELESNNMGNSSDDFDYDKFLETEKKLLEERKQNIVPTDLRIGFIGLGIMGGFIVNNLLRTGHNVTVWNRTPDKCEKYVEAGAKQAQTPGDVVVESDIIFSCLSETHAIKEIFCGNCGVMKMIQECNEPGKGYIEMTTIDPKTSAEHCEVLASKQGRYLELPILGTRKDAEDGTLILLAAGDKDLYDSAESCFRAIGRKHLWLDKVGTASTLNLIANSVMGTCYSAVGEAMALADQVGFPRSKVLEILKNRQLHFPATLPVIVERACKSIVEETFTDSQIPLQHLQRNLYLALLMGDQLYHPLPVTSAVNEIFKLSRRLGYGEHDVSAVYLKARSAK